MIHEDGRRGPAQRAASPPNLVYITNIYLHKSP